MTSLGMTLSAWRSTRFFRGDVMEALDGPVTGSAIEREVRPEHQLAWRVKLAYPSSLPQLRPDHEEAQMAESYYELIETDEYGEKFTATDLVRSTWNAAIQHAAPVASLLVRAIERCAARDDNRLSRVAVDLLGGVPADGELWVRSRVDRPGRQIELISAEMLAPGLGGTPRLVAKASGWRIATLDTSGVMRASAPALRPLSDAKSRDSAKNWELNHVHSLDWRWLTTPMADGPGESWLRPTVDLVNGEAMTPLQRLFAVADDANGVGAKLDIRNWTFMNTDLIVHVHRLPEGEWIGIRADCNYGPDGIGTTVGTLFDERGSVGDIQQSLLLRPVLYHQ
jgi:acyl-Coa thioesterase superfamily protein/acyl-CoA thioesterase superfamily protein